MDTFLEVRKSVIQVAQTLSAGGFFGTQSGTGGNVSARCGEEGPVAVTPSGHPYQDLQPEDICIVDLDGRQLSGELRPSIETGMHLSVYRTRPEVGAVLHTHQHYASVLSVINEPIPPLFDEVSLHLGDPVEVVPYGPSGSPELAAHVAACVGNGASGYILQNHGALCLGRTLEEALTNVEMLEKAARVYYHTLCTGKEAIRLPQETLAMIEGLRKPAKK